MNLYFLLVDKCEPSKKTPDAKEQYYTIIIIIKSLFIEGTGISKHKCVKSSRKKILQLHTMISPIT